MGSIKQTYMKRIGDQLIEKHEKEFNTDFDNNKKKVSEYCTVDGKSIRNKIAGYITKAIKQKNKAS